MTGEVGQLALDNLAEAPPVGHERRWANLADEGEDRLVIGGGGIAG